MSHPHPDDSPPDDPRARTTQPDTAPPGTAVSGFPEPPGTDPGDRSRDATPYSALNVPVTEPDPTEWPDPYDHRDDPRAPDIGMVFPGDGRSHTVVGATTTSEPHPAADIEAPDANAPDTDILDDRESGRRSRRR